MGYLTLFTINFSHNKDAILKYIEKLLAKEKVRFENFKEKYKNLKANDFYLQISYKEDFYWNTQECVKWYDYEADVLRISNKFPDVVISVYGNGEDDGDKWVQYFYNGKKTVVYVAKITIEYKDFDKKDLE